MFWWQYRKQHPEKIPGKSLPQLIFWLSWNFEATFMLLQIVRQAVPRRVTVVVSEVPTRLRTKSTFKVVP